jgi:hypothetical protein
MVGYINRVPHFKTPVYCSEINLKQYKIILKSLLTDKLTDEFVVNINNLLQEVTSLSLSELNKINFVEYLILLIYLRIKNTGSIIKLIITDNDKKMRVSADLKNTITNLSSALHLVDKNIKFDELMFTIGLPTFNTFINKSDYPFIKAVQFKENIFTSSDDIKAVVNSLTYNNFKTLETVFNQYKDVINGINFYTSKIEKYNIPFVPTTDNVLFLLKLIYNDDLLSLYNDIFYLSKNANLSTTYLENCTPGEFKLYIKTLEQSQQPIETSEQDQDLLTNQI